MRRELAHLDRRQHSMRAGVIQQLRLVVQMVLCTEKRHRERRHAVLTRLHARTV
jgi:hypothetical protein